MERMAAHSKGVEPWLPLPWADRPGARREGGVETLEWFTNVPSSENLLGSRVLVSRWFPYA